MTTYDDWKTYDAAAEAAYAEERAIEAFYDDARANLAKRWDANMSCDMTDSWNDSAVIALFAEARTSDDATLIGTKLQTMARSAFEAYCRRELEDEARRLLELDGDEA